MPRTEAISRFTRIYLLYWEMRGQLTRYFHTLPFVLHPITRRKIDHVMYELRIVC